MLEIGKVKSNC